MVQRDYHCRSNDSTDTHELLILHYYGLLQTLQAPNLASHGALEVRFQESTQAIRQTKSRRYRLHMETDVGCAKFDAHNNVYLFSFFHAFAATYMQKRFRQYPPWRFQARFKMLSINLVIYLPARDGQGLRTRNEWI